MHQRAFCIWFLIGCIPGMAQTVMESPPDTLAEISTAMQKFVDSGDIAGSVTLVGKHGKIVHHAAVGLADIEGGRPMEKKTIFSIASMTKPIVATGLLILQDEGKLHVEDPVSQYIPEFESAKWKGGNQVNRPITIRDLLTHTSGLAGDQVFEGSLRDAVERLARQPLAFEPGTRWQYSPGLNVAGRIIEIVSEKPLDKFLAEKLFTPLGMHDTTFFPAEQQFSRIATIYEPGQEKQALVPTRNFIVDSKNAQAPNPSGGLFSTAGDLFRFYQMILDQGVWQGNRIVSADAVQQMTQNQTGDLVTGFTPGNCWGLGWCIVRKPQGVTGMLSPGTFGHGGAYGTQGWVDPGTKTIYVLMIQRAKLPNSDASEIRETFQKLAAQSIR
ncbi:MAG: beta-lactamase family protein [Pirellulales bacterium]|nr:beta-lactamase family protein [Pirellulales bacterium]